MLNIVLEKCLLRDFQFYGKIFYCYFFPLLVSFFMLYKVVYVHDDQFYV